MIRVSLLALDRGCKGRCVTVFGSWVACYSVWIVVDIVGIVEVRVSVLLCLDRG